MGIVIFYILICIGTSAAAVFYAVIMKKYYKLNNGHFSSFSVFSYGFFLLCYLSVSLSWIIDFAYQWVLLIPLALPLLISFHATFRVVRHYKKVFLMFFLFLIGVPTCLSIKCEQDRVAAEHFFADNFSDVYYASPQYLDHKYFHFIKREEMALNFYIIEKDFFNLETLEVNPVLVPNIVNLQNSFFNSARNILYVNNKAYNLKDNEIYILKCEDFLYNNSLQNLFKDKKVLCIGEYIKYPFDDFIKNNKYNNIINHYNLQNLPKKFGFTLKFLLNVKPYMYNEEAKILKEDILFSDTIFLYKNPNTPLQRYYNPRLKEKNFCPVSITPYGDLKCIEFRKLFIPLSDIR